MNLAHTILFCSFLPAIGAVLLLLLPTKISVSRFSTLTLFITTLFFAFIWICSAEKELLLLFHWLPTLTVGWRMDKVSIALLFLVSFISFLVHVFSVAYMAHDTSQKRYYVLLGFFTTAMLLLLIADHLILFFIFWELVGFCSYLLIGFWFQKDDIAQAARSTFMTNRVADALLLSGILVWWSQGNDMLMSAFEQPSNFTIFTQLSLILVIFGAFGKSAQFPFFAWLPRAMVGPTPVSALIHAATMVAAGVYLVFRFSIVLSPLASLILIVFSLFTALAAALFATRQYDIKAILAYSTISQLGLMLVAIGAQNAGVGVFHLWTHAFFKAGLFLGAAAIMMYVHDRDHKVDAQDIRLMGAFRQGASFLFVVFIILGSALIGLPFLSSFFSKDGLLLGVVNWALTQKDLFGAGVWLVPILMVVTFILTAFYVSRLIWFVFLGKTRAGFDVSASHKFNLMVVSPLVILMVSAAWFWYSLNPLGHIDQFAELRLPVSSSGQSAGIAVLTILSAMTGVGMTFILYHQKRVMTKETPGWLYHGFHLKIFYEETLAKFVYRLAFFCQNVDKKFIDKAVNIMGILGVLTAKAVDMFDKLIVDGVVNMLAGLVAAIGRLYNLFHAARVQLHLIWAFIGIGVFYLLILIWF